MPAHPRPLRCAAAQGYAGLTCIQLLLSGWSFFISFMCFAMRCYAPVTALTGSCCRGMPYARQVESGTSATQAVMRGHAANGICAAAIRV